MWSRFFVSSILIGFVLSAPSAFARDARILPLTRIRIYETGIAYFERAGRVPDDRSVGVPLPAGHLDDALKTLVLLDPEKNSGLSGVEFESAVSHERARALARVSNTGEYALDYGSLIESLRGQDVVLEAGHHSLRGQVVDVVRAEDSSLTRCMPTEPPRDGHCVPKGVAALVLAGADGSLRRFALGEVTSIRPALPEQQRVLTSALRTLSGSRDSVTRTLRLEAKAGSRVAIGYLGEAPLWRASYRLLLDEDESATLQGWALLHNDSNEDWQGVKVELVNGRPDSFLFPLAAPRYAPRELVTPDQQLSTVPQLFSQSVDDMWSGTDMVAGGLGLSGIGSGGGGYGEGVGLGRIGVAGSGRQGEETDLLSVGNLAASRAATAVEKGALFLYTLEEPLALEAKHSSLVPFLTRSLEAERFVLFESAGEPGRSVLSVENSGATTLPSGPVAVFEAGGLAGESALERLKPGQRQLVTFGTDLDFEIDELGRTKSEQVRKVGFSEGKLDVHYVKRQLVTLRLTNRAGHDKRALLRLNLVNNAKVSGADVHYDDATHVAYAKLSAPAGRSHELRLTLEEGLRRRIALEDLSIWRLNRYAASPALSQDSRQILARAAQALDESYERMFRAARLRAGLASLKAESQRLQRTIRSVSATHSARSEVLMQQLVATERRIEVTAREIQRVESVERWAALREELARLPGTE